MGIELPTLEIGHQYEVLRDPDSLNLEEDHPVIRFWRVQMASNVECVILRSDFDLFLVPNPDESLLTGVPQVIPNFQFFYQPTKRLPFS